MPELRELCTDGDRQLTVPEAAYLFRCSTDTIYALIHKGALERCPRQIMSNVRVYETDVLYELSPHLFLEHPREARHADRPVRLTPAGERRRMPQREPAADSAVSTDPADYAK